MFTGKGFADRYLSKEEINQVVHEGIGSLPIDGKRVLVIIPDGTRTMPMPLMYDLLETHLAPRAAVLDYIVALGTHPIMTDEQLSKLVGRTVTIMHNGTLTIDRKEIPGVTGGALDANEGEPGTFYIQGDHTLSLIHI